MTKSVKEKSRQTKIRLYENGVGDLSIDDIRFSINHQIQFMAILGFRKDGIKFKLKPKFTSKKSTILKIPKKTYFSYLQVNRLIEVKNLFGQKLEDKIKEHILSFSKQIGIYNWKITILYKGMNNFLYNATIKLTGSKNNSKENYYFSLEGFDDFKTNHDYFSVPERTNVFGSFFNEDDIQIIEDSISKINGFSIRLYYNELSKKDHNKKLENTIFKKYEKIKSFSALNHIETPYCIKYFFDNSGAFFSLEYGYEAKLKNEKILTTDAFKDDKSFLIHLISIGVFGDVDNLKELEKHDFDAIIDQLSIQTY